MNEENLGEKPSKKFIKSNMEENMKIDFWIEGQKVSVKKGELQTGFGIMYHMNGKKLFEGDFVKGKYEGFGTLFHTNGNKYYEGRFKDDKYEGQGTEWDPKGGVRYEGTWSHGMLFSFETPKTPGLEEAGVRVENPRSFNCTLSVELAN